MLFSRILQEVAVLVPVVLLLTLNCIDLIVSMSRVYRGLSVHLSEINKIVFDTD